MSEAFQIAFNEEAQEILEELEKDLLALEASSEDIELINKIFRGLHTIKGSGAMFGFNNISEFAHELETVFDHVRNSRLKINPNIIAISLDSIDFLKSILDDPQNLGTEDERGKQLIVAIKAILNVNDSQAGVALQPAKEKKESIENRKVYRILFKPDKNIFTKGINPLNILSKLEELGKVFCFVHEDDVPEIGKLNPEICYTYFTCILITDVELNEIKDVFIFTEDSCELSISEIFSSSVAFEQNSVPLIGEILFSKGDITREEIEAVLGKHKLFGERAIEMGFTSREKVESALFEQNTLHEIKKEIISHPASSSIRVHNEKLNILTDSISELVTLQARLTQFAGAKKETELTSMAEYLEKITSSLRDTVMMIRMVPVEDGFTSMHRLVHDLARDLHKEVKLTITGGDTELDKSIIDILKDPVMHLIRNCVDHGLESPDERIKAGKPQTGQIIINAEHVGSHVNISISDDGKGLDKDKILAKAIQKGIASSSDNLTETEIFQLIFLPGFSTAEKTTNISGRGVGMDVVKRNIESIRGEVFLESIKDSGTTVRLKLPITLAIIDGLLFSVGKELFVVNISSVIECLELTQEIRDSAGEQSILKLRDSIIPFVHLRSVLNIPGKPPEHEQIIILHTHEQTIGFVVDTVQGKHQTVVKTTGRLFANVKEVIGATILGDGRIALILDVNAIAQKINEKSCITIS